MADEWTEEEGKLLRHEKFISKLIQIRTNEKPDSHSLLKLLFESAGGAALITVLIGGLATALVTSCFQARMKNRDFEAAVLNAYNGYQLETGKAFVKEQIQVTNEALDLLGRISLRTRNLLDSNDPDFLTTDADSQRHARKIEQDFEEATDTWRQRQNSLGMSLAYYHGKDPQAIGWDKVSIAADAYINCARNYRPPPKADREEMKKRAALACKAPQEEAFKEAISALVHQLQNTEGSWKGFKDYDEMRKYLRLSMAVPVEAPGRASLHDRASLPRRIMRTESYPECQARGTDRRRALLADAFLGHPAPA